MEQSAETSKQPWRYRAPVVIALLVLVFPLGLWLMYRSAWPSKPWKLPVGVVFAFVFVVNVHCFSRLEVYFHGTGMPRFGLVEPVPENLASAVAGTSGGTYVFPDQIDDSAQWLGFRGGHRDGIVRGPELALPWPDDGPRLLWKKPIGGGWSSFAIYGGAAFTMEQRGRQEVVSCYAVEDGEEIWIHAYDARFAEAMGGVGPRATPSYVDGRVYALGGTGILTCLDAATGEKIWRRDILKDASASNIQWGQAGSPLVHSGRVFVAPGGANASVLAYEAVSGEIKWKSGSNKAGYSSPVIGTLAGIDHLLVLDGKALSTYSPNDGAPLWSYPWRTEYDINVAQPIVTDENRLVIGSAYGVGVAMLRVTRSDGGFDVKKLWKSKRLKLKFTSAILHEDHIYGLDEAVLTCIDLDGKRRWKGGRYGYGQPILAQGHLIVLCDNGDLALVKATADAFSEISRVDALKGRTWNHPAMADGKLLIRNDREMACYDLAAE